MVRSPVKTPDPSHDPVRTLVRPETPIPATSSPKSEARRSREQQSSGQESEGDFEPRYLTMPSRKARGQGGRNLFIGVVLLGIAAILLGWALYVAGPGAIFTVAVSLATAAALYVIARARLLRQRNGAFLAGAIVCVLAVFLVLVQQAWLTALRMSALPPSDTSNTAATSAEPTAAPKATGKKSGAAVAAAARKPEESTEDNVPSLWQAFRPSPVELESGPVGRVRADADVDIDGKTYRLRAGETYPVVPGRANDGNVRLAAGKQVVGVPSSLVVVSDAETGKPTSADISPERAREIAKAFGEAKAPSGPAGKIDENDKSFNALVARSQAEAVKKYPALGVQGTPENESFRDAYKEAYNDFKFGGSSNSFLKDPDWPLHLAELLAKREGWGGEPPQAAAPRPDEREMVTSPEEQLAPAAAAPPADSLNPPPLEDNEVAVPTPAPQYPRESARRSGRSPREEPPLPTRQ